MSEIETAPADFPIMSCNIIASIPWAFIAPHEAQAQRNHGQSLKRLAQRGGLSVPEALDVIEGRKWNSASYCEANDRHLINLVRAWRVSVKTS